MSSDACRRARRHRHAPLSACSKCLAAVAGNNPLAGGVAGGSRASVAGVAAEPHAVAAAVATCQHADTPALPTAVTMLTCPPMLCPCLCLQPGLPPCCDASGRNCSAACSTPGSASSERRAPLAATWPTFELEFECIFKPAPAGFELTEAGEASDHD